MSLPVVILAGGLGTRLEKETLATPKPMVQIGKYPILIHIMARYSKFGFKNFIICGGYKIEVIIDYFRNLPSRLFDTEYTFADGEVKQGILMRRPSQIGVEEEFHNWNIKIIDSGLETTTAGRIADVKDLLQNTERFLCTYGDGVADIDLNALLNFHLKSGKLATVTAVNPPSRFGDLAFDNQGTVTSFSEKSLSSAYINGGFFVFESPILEGLDRSKSLEEGLISDLSRNGNLSAYLHRGYWQNMDTPREKQILMDLHLGGNAPWLI